MASVERGQIISWNEHQNLGIIQSDGSQQVTICLESIRRDMRRRQRRFAPVVGALVDFKRHSSGHIATEWWYPLLRPSIGFDAERQQTAKALLGSCLSNWEIEDASADSSQSAAAGIEMFQAWLGDYGIAGTFYQVLTAIYLYEKSCGAPLPSLVPWPDMPRFYLSDGYNPSRVPYYTHFQAATMAMQNGIGQKVMDLWTTDNPPSLSVDEASKVLAVCNREEYVNSAQTRVSWIDRRLKTEVAFGFFGATKPYVFIGRSPQTSKFRDDEAQRLMPYGLRQH